MKNKSDLDDASRIVEHDLVQPLNVIRLAAGNIRSRILPQLTAGEATYLASKLERIERQVDRTAALVAELYGSPCNASQRGN